MTILTAYQEKCLRLAFARGRYLLPGIRSHFGKLTEAGFVRGDRAGFGAVWIHPLPAGIAHIQRRTAYITETI